MEVDNLVTANGDIRLVNEWEEPEFWRIKAGKWYNRLSSVYQHVNEVNKKWEEEENKKI